MKLGYLLFLLFLLFPKFLSSEEIRVATGEHENFTRIVLQANNVEDLKISKSGNLLQVESEIEDTFYLRNVFSRIGKDKIENFSEKSGTLSIFLSCSCEVEYAIYDDILTIDIFDNYQEDLENVGRSDDGLNSINSLDFYNYSSFNETLPTEEYIRESQSDRSVYEDNDKLINGSENVNIFDPLNTLSDARQVNSLKSEYSTFVEGCFFDDLFEIEYWFDENYNDKYQANFSKSIVNAKGQFSQDELENGIREFIFYGLAVEALYLIEFYEGNNAHIYKWLAEIINNTMVEVTTPIGVNCAPRSDFWQYMSEFSSSNIIYSTSSLFETFDALPEKLKKILGPRFINKLQDDQYSEMAELVLNSLSRSFHGDVGLRLVSAEAAVKSGSYQLGQSDLEEIVHSVSNLGPAPTTSLINSYTDYGINVPESYVNLAEAYVEEFQGTDEGSEIWLSLINSLLVNLDFDSAYTKILKKNKWMGETVVSEAINTFTASVLKKGSDSTFLKYFWGQEDWFYDGMSGNLKLQAAERLLELGFYEEVDRYISSGNVDVDSDRFRYVQAQTMLLKDKPLDAEISLVGLADRKAVEIRAKSRMNIGDLQYASALYASIGDENRAALLDWISGNVGSPYILNDSRLGSYSHLLNVDLNVFENNSSLLEKIQDDRRQLERLKDLSWSIN